MTGWSYQDSIPAAPTKEDDDINWHEFFNTFEEYHQWKVDRLNYHPPTPENEEVRQRKIWQTLKHWGWGQTDAKIKAPVDFMEEGYIVPPPVPEVLPNPRLLQPPQPQEEPSGLQPRCSTCERRPAIHPDNVYGSQNPTQSEQMSS
jgi:hypothetical protein